MTLSPLTRDELARRVGDAASAPAPVRIIHLGLGHFFRAHQAWYTAHAADAGQWGIAAFTGRSVAGAEAFKRQDGLFTLVGRGPDGDQLEVIGSVVEAVAGHDVQRLAALARDPQVAVITLTVTESGYRLTTAGLPDLDDGDVRADLAELRAGESAARTVLGRLLTALHARRDAAVGPIAVVPCDNIPGNGDFVARGLTAFAERVDPALAAWITANVSFVSTSVDRITPHTDEVPAVVADAGWLDDLTVITEPFSDWVLAGDFPAGRPDWESAGARFVDDIEPWENRKLWLLNGAHSLLTFAGMPRGLDTVAEAIADPECRALVESFWDEVVACLPDGTEHMQYRRQLIERFENPRIVHRLAQIAAEATTKVEFRFAAVAERSLAAGRDASASARALATWITWLSNDPGAVDVRADAVAAAAASDDSVSALIGLVSPRLASLPAFVDVVRRFAQDATAAHAR
ncbi:mannitol dehydrogenase family protein [Microbacterium sp. C7(2022)]|uniref:mannitol dehydrogenase family protein n=1 Tax=Microbacterium sp. C7(2022) TaxID=2992759 RepID=UPI00237A9DD6|nr:mannitol dehydrogenase family protein [Microbacterium sp. C7(2022)]MDE0545951.1 mannitol dehydrogenase family protein [Microbacterium sp. C7(2022)]